MANDPGGSTGGANFNQIILQQAAAGMPIEQIASNLGLSPQIVAQVLSQSGYNVTPPSNSGYNPLTGLLNPGKYSYSKSSNQPTPAGGQTSGAGPVGQDAGPSGSGPGSTGTNSTGANNNLINPNGQSTSTYDPNVAALAASQRNYAADLAEKQREFDVTTARDLAKQQGQEVDALQQRLASLSGPKDAYADYFFAHGLLPPQGYKPAPVPLTQAQIDAYGRMGVTPQQLQQMIGGTGQPGVNAGMLGNLGSSLQTPAGQPQPLQQGSFQGQAQVNNPTQQGGVLFGKTPPGGTNVPTTPGGVPSMAVGGQVPGPPGTPKLAVLHGGEEVTPASQSGGSGVSSQLPPPSPQQSGAMMDQPGLHPAISALVDAVSNLLSSPDFKPFVQATQQTNQATSGGVPSMALGGTMPPVGMGSGNVSPLGNSSLSPWGSSAPIGSASGGSPLGNVPPMPQSGAQGINPNTTNPQPKDNPIMPLSNMDPYSRALYDVHGRLHPYSAQQEMQMGPAGIDAVSSYVGKVQGGDIKQYQDLVNRLRPGSGAPAMGDVQNEGFITG